MKGVFRVGPGWLVQSAAQGLGAQDSAYRRAPTEEFLEAWRALLRDAANSGRETSRSR